ncbi:MAG: hypothetical protein LBC89_00700 [Bacteroidales bacterium]|jgi:hypothetical protein|nr:hypothetical protein [Bacteroidales bacterium]
MKSQKCLLLAMILICLFFNAVAQESVEKRNKANRQFETFDFSKPVHSFGIYYTSGFSFRPRVKDAQGLFHLAFSSPDYIPELNLRYSMSIKNGWGFAVEIPVGFFRGYTGYHLEWLIPNDVVWADGKAVGPGLSPGSRIVAPYVGATFKFSYLAQIHRNVFIQPEAGIKFMPFIFPVKSNTISADIFYLADDGLHGYETDVLWLENQPSTSLKHYAVPDVTLALHFIVHGKKPHHNFIFGINANIGWHDRVSFNYHTTDVLPAHLKSSGKYGWKSSYIGFHIGYQFMTAGKRR